MKRKPPIVTTDSPIISIIALLGGIALGIYIGLAIG